MQNIKWPGGSKDAFVELIASKKLEFYKRHPECFTKDNPEKIIDMNTWFAFIEKEGVLPLMPEEQVDE